MNKISKETAREHVVTGPFRGCRCAVCHTRKLRMTAGQIENLPGLPTYRTNRKKGVEVGRLVKIF